MIGTKNASFKVADTNALLTLPDDEGCTEGGCSEGTFGETLSERLSGLELVLRTS